MRRRMAPAGFRGFRGGALAVAAALSWPAAARAANERAAVVVVVEGPRAEAVAGWLEDGLGAPDTLQEERAFRGALRARGALPLHLAVNNEARDARLIACAHAAAGEADVAGALLVDLQKLPTGIRIHVWSIDARPGGTTVERDITRPASANVLDLSRGILASLPPLLAPATPVAQVATGATATEPAKGTPAPATVPAFEHPMAHVDAGPAPDKVPSRAPEGGPSPITLQAAIGIGTRRFSYVDRITPTLRPYDLPAAPMASVAAVIYPLAFTHTPVLRDFGVTGDYARAFAFSSEDSTGDVVGTTWQSFDVGATERIPLTRALVANVAVGFGGDDFLFDQSLAGTAAALPSVSYRFVRAGGDLRASFLSAFTAFGGGSYLDLLSTGYVGDLFPRQSVGGVEGHLGASYAIARSFELSVSGSYSRFFYSFNPVPGDANVAGGALDEQTRILAGLSYVM
ncbi:MAG: hypothetical protein ACLQVI_10345 [Polyangiaceae bacterium]